MFGCSAFTNCSGIAEYKLCPDHQLVCPRDLECYSTGLEVYPAGLLPYQKQRFKSYKDSWSGLREVPMLRGE
jgi:hypothetical protein